MNIELADVVTRFSRSSGSGARRHAVVLFLVPVWLVACHGPGAQAEAVCRGADAPGSLSAQVCDRGRHLTRLLYGRHLALLEQSSEKVDSVSATHLAALLAQVARQLGTEVMVLDEEVRAAAFPSPPPSCGVRRPSTRWHYVRRAEFSRTKETVRLVWQVSKDLRIIGLRVLPEGRLSASTRTPLRLPVRGLWHIAEGGDDRSIHGLVRDLFAETFAVQLTVRRLFAPKVRDRARVEHTGDGTRNEHYFVYHQPVVAPAPGVVERTTDGIAEHPPYTPPHGAGHGNEVVLVHANGERSFLRNLAPGLQVVPGQRVDTGDVLGRVGNSGDGRLPRLNYHVADAHGRGLPVVFSQVEIRGYGFEVYDSCAAPQLFPRLLVQRGFNVSQPQADMPAGTKP